MFENAIVHPGNRANAGLQSSNTKRGNAMTSNFLSFSRRALLGAMGLALAASLPAKADPRVLVIANDIGDTVSLDPARMATYTPALALHTAYDTLVTMDPGDYVTVKPQLAESFARTPDGKGWRFKLRSGLTFASGNPMTADDVKFSLDRMLNMKDQPAGYFRTVSKVEKVDDRTIDIYTQDPNDPLLTILCAPAGSVLDSKLVKQHGGTDAADAKDTDKATNWLNTTSAGSGPYQIISWERNGSIVLQRNPHYWRGTPAYQRVIIRHIAESGAQLLAIRRGDADVAFNLTPEQIKSVEGDKDIAIARAVSQDWTYIALTNNPEVSEPLTKREARLAIAYSIDYDGMRDSLVGGAATRPANYISVGIGGSTEELTKEIGYREDLAKAKELLAQAGSPDGFSFALYYQAGSFGGVPYQLMAQKIQADVARVGIKAELKPMDPVTLRTMFVNGRTSAAFGYWNPPAPEPLLNAEAVFKRGAQRVKWNIPQEIADLAVRASRATNQEEQNKLYREFTEAVQKEGHFIVLFQPYYQVAVRKSVADFTLTGAGWFAELGRAKPAQ
jgi:peptide/nickel transport system substrate-binding protein